MSKYIATANTLLKRKITNICGKNSERLFFMGDFKILFIETTFKNNGDSSHLSRNIKAAIPNKKDNKNGILQAKLTICSWSKNKVISIPKPEPIKRPR